MFGKLVLCSSGLLLCGYALGEGVTPQLLLKDEWNNSGNTYGLGIMLPYISAQGQTPFADLRYFADNHGGKVASIGGGYRYPLDNGSYLGFNGYLDAGKRKDSSTLWGGSVGMEWLSEAVEISSNIYFPLSKRSLGASRHYATLRADRLGITTDKDYAEMAHGADIHAAKSIYQNGNIDIQAAVAGYWRKAGLKKNSGGELKLNVRTHPFGKDSHVSLAPYVRMDNQDKTQFGVMFSIGFGGDGGSSRTLLSLRPVDRVSLNAPFQYRESTFEKASNIGKVQIFDLANAENASAAMLNNKIAALGQDGVAIVTGKRSYNDTVVLQDTQSLYGADSEIALTTDSGKMAIYRIEQQPAHIHQKNEAVDVLKVGSDTTVSNLVLSGGAHAVSNNGLGTHGIHLSDLDISKTSADGVHLNQASNVYAANLNIHDLKICEDNTTCEYSFFKPDYAPNVAFSAVASDNIYIKDSKIDNVTYGVFVASTQKDWQSWDKLSKEIQIDNLSIRNTRREGLLFTGVDGADVRNLTIDNRQNAINQKPDMDLVVLQASKNISMSDSLLKGGVNGLMMVNAPGLPTVSENNFKFKNIEVSETSRANVFFNPVNGVSLDNVRGSHAGTVGMFMMGNDYLGHLANIEMKDVHIDTAKDAGIDVMGPIDNVSGNLTIDNTATICHQASPWMPGVLTQDNGGQWNVNGKLFDDFSSCL